MLSCQEILEIFLLLLRFLLPRITSPAATPHGFSIHQVTCAFADGANSSLSFQVVVGGNNVPEDNTTLTFAFESSSLSGGVAVGASDPVTLTLICNDDPNGVIGFPVSIYSGAAENSTVNLTVSRSLGLFGAVSADWRIRDNSSDFEGPGFGVVAFAAQQSTAVIALRVRADGTPDLQAARVVELGNATGGARIDAQTNTTTIVIPENDHPYGLLGLRSAGFSQSSTSREVLVSVERLFGTVGTVDMNITTRCVLPLDHVPHFRICTAHLIIF